MFETTYVCAEAYTREKLPNFSVGVLQAPKTAHGTPEAGFWVGCLLPAYSLNGTIFGGQSIKQSQKHTCLLYASFDGGCTVGRYDPPNKVHSAVNTISGSRKTE